MDQDIPLPDFPSCHDSGFGQNTSKYSSVLRLISFAQLTDEFLSFKPVFAPFHRLMGSYHLSSYVNFIIFFAIFRIFYVINSIFSVL